MVDRRNLGLVSEVAWTAKHLNKKSGGIVIEIEGENLQARAKLWKMIEVVIKIGRGNPPVGGNLQH